MPSASDYTALITAFHAARPKFVSTVSASVDPIAGATNFMAGIPAAFDLDTAIGAQLDVVGQWVGRSRYIATPIPNLYFSFGGDGSRGWGRGIWKGPYDTTSGIIRLDDDTYRLILRAKIAANNWDGTIATAQADLATIFAGSGANVFISDNQDMSMTFGVSGKIPSLLILALLSAGYIPLKPEGVKAFYRVVSVDSTPLFGFGVQNQYVSGFGTGSWGVPPSYFTA